MYYRDNENGMIYLDADALKEGTVLRKEDSEDTYALKVKETLRGVYNINKGYAEFGRCGSCAKAMNITSWKAEAITVCRTMTISP